MEWEDWDPCVSFFDNKVCVPGFSLLQSLSTVVLCSVSVSCGVAEHWKTPAVLAWYAGHFWHSLHSMAE
jgi:hypothetical protein